MYSLNSSNAPTKIESTTFADLNLKEKNIEEMLRVNLGMLFDDGDDETMLIVGQQVQTEAKTRSDLTAIDKDGNIVLIEIKRDKDDIIKRLEAVEFQAVRYAAAYASIETPDDLIREVYSGYVEKHKDEFVDHKELTSTEIAQRKLDRFIKNNQITSFNKLQRIMIVASGFDDDSLSAIAWLNSNNVDISCYQICPYKYKDDIIITFDKILPLKEYKDFFLAINGNRVKDKKPASKKTQLPKIASMLRWGVINAGDILVAKNSAEEAELLADGNVKLASGTTCSINQWLIKVYGWSTVQTYVYAIDKRSGKSLAEIREEYMEQHEDAE